jgi:hypothetical protein
MRRSRTLTSLIVFAGSLFMALPAAAGDDLVLPIPFPVIGRALGTTISR